MIAAEHKNDIITTKRDTYKARKMTKMGRDTFSRPF